jgi:integrase
MARKRRTRSPHPGVVLIRPTGRYAAWRARFVDPDTGNTVWARLDPAALSTAETRRDWAIQKSKALAKRRLALEDGAPRATGTALGDALDRYFKAHPQLRDRTRAIYRAAADKLGAWAGRHGVGSADELTRAKLLAFREHLVSQPKRVPKRTKLDAEGRVLQRAERGTYVATGQPRSPAAVNQDLRALRTVLGYLRELDLLPKLSHDDLRRALKRLPNNTERAEYLRPGELQKLLEAALRHDAAKVTTREDEHRLRREAARRGLTRKALAARGPAGGTPRYEPIAPFVAFLLLTGMRLGEAMELEWSQVDLDARDAAGEKAGEIHLAGAATKTHKARTVGLEVSPALRKMLAALHLASGGKGKVFPLTRGTIDAATKRLRDEYGAPEAFSWQMLRSSCATYLTNAPGIFGAASAYRSAKQLGHSVTVAEKHYTDVLRGIPRDARTLEAAMGIEDVVGRIGPGRSAGLAPRVAQGLRNSAQT